jgi:hypothetical protein
MGNEKCPRSCHVTAPLPPHPPPAWAERRAITWLELTACDTYTGWGTQIRPRFSLVSLISFLKLK